MATVPLTAQAKTYAGLTPTFTNAGGIGAGNGFVFDNPDGKSDFRIKNASGSPITATIKARGSVGGVALADQTFAVPADEVLTVRAYVMAPSGTTARDFSFDLTSLDEQRESDRSETRFSAPGDQP